MNWLLGKVKKKKKKKRGEGGDAGAEILKVFSRMIWHPHFKIAPSVVIIRVVMM